MRHSKCTEFDCILQSEIDYYLEVCEYCGNTKHDFTCCGENHFKRIIVDIYDNEWDEETTRVIKDIDGPYGHDFNR